MKYIQDYKTFEGVGGTNDYVVGDIVVIMYENTNGDPILTPVKIVVRHSANSFTVSHKTDDSNLKNFPDLTIRYSQIISLYKDLNKPSNNNQTTQNPRINPNVSNFVPGANGQPVNDITQLAANQNPSNDIAI